eukprot:gene29682-759_t
MLTPPVRAGRSEMRDAVHLLVIVATFAARLHWLHAAPADNESYDDPAQNIIHASYDPAAVHRLYDTYYTYSVMYNPDTMNITYRRAHDDASWARRYDAAAFDSAIEGVADITPQEAPNTTHGPARNVSDAVHSAADVAAVVLRDAPNVTGLPMSPSRPSGGVGDPFTYPSDGPDDEQKRSSPPSFFIPELTFTMAPNPITTIQEQAHLEAKATLNSSLSHSLLAAELLATHDCYSHYLDLDFDGLPHDIVASILSLDDPWEREFAYTYTLHQLAHVHDDTPRRWNVIGGCCGGGDDDGVELGDIEIPLTCCFTGKRLTDPKVTSGMVQDELETEHKKQGGGSLSENQQQHLRREFYQPMLEYVAAVVPDVPDGIIARADFDSWKPHFADEVRDAIDVIDLDAPSQSAPKFFTSEPDLGAWFVPDQPP